MAQILFDSEVMCSGYEESLHVPIRISLVGGGIRVGKWSVFAKPSLFRPGFGEQIFLPWCAKNTDGFSGSGKNAGTEKFLTGRDCKRKISRSASQNLSG